MISTLLPDIHHASEFPLSLSLRLNQSSRRILMLNLHWFSRFIKYILSDNKIRFASCFAKQIRQLCAKTTQFRPPEDPHSELERASVGRKELLINKLDPRIGSKNSNNIMPHASKHLLFSFLHSSYHLLMRHHSIRSLIFTHFSIILILFFSSPSLEFLASLTVIAIKVLTKSAEIPIIHGHNSHATIMAFC